MLNAQVVTLGVITGMSYGLLGIGVVIVYRNSRVLNMAQGDLAALIAGLMPWLAAGVHLNYWVALVLAIASGAAAGVVFESLIIRPLASGSRLILTIATIGAAQAYFVISLFIPLVRNFGTGTFPVPFNVNWKIGSVEITSPDVPLLFGGPIVCILLAVYFRRTSLGLASRAVVDNPEAAALAGISLRKISLATWMIASTLAGVSGVLVGPLEPVVQRTQIAPDLLERGLAAAMIGGLTSLTGAFIGGIAVGILEAIILFNSTNAGMTDVALLLVVVLALAIRRRDSLVRRGGGVIETLVLATSVQRLPYAIRTRFGVRAFHATLALVALAALVIVGSTLELVYVDDLAQGLVFALMLSSLVVITGYTGQLSFGQSAFIAIGAILGGRLLVFNMNWWVALLCVTLAGAAIAGICGIPALRIRGIYLALISLALATAAGSWLFTQNWLIVISPDGSSSLQILRPSIAGFSFNSDRSYYMLLVAAMAVVWSLIWLLRQSRLGRAMFAVRENELQAEAHGISPVIVKLTAFSIGGGIAAFSGFLYGCLLENFPDPSIFAAALSLSLIAFAIVGGIDSLAGVGAAGIMLFGVGTIISTKLPGLLGENLVNILGGVGLLLVIVQNPRGIAGVLVTQRDWVLKKLRLYGPGSSETTTDDDVDVEIQAILGHVAPEAPPTEPGAAVELIQDRLQPVNADSGGPGLALEVCGVSVTFGGNRVLDHVDMEVPEHNIVGIVGANGAGKTTLLDAIGGTIRCDGGTIRLHGRDVTRMSAHRRARLGLARSFQQAKLYPELTVRDTLSIAFDQQRHIRHSSPMKFSGAVSRSRNEEIQWYLELFGLERYADLQIVYASSGMRRIIEFATIAALGSRVILLDEPTAGIAHREIELFPEVLQRIRSVLGASMLVIEHDFGMLSAVADSLYVLDHGRVLGHGSAETLLADEAVVNAYLGVDDRVVRRSDVLGSRVR